MEWALIPLVLLVALCPLMMIGMMVGGWIFGRRVMGGHGSHGGHGMMMCMGHGGNDGSDQQASEPADPSLVEELKAERERLDRLIARAEREVTR